MRKPKINLDEDEQDDENEILNQVMIGDVLISSKKAIKNPTRIIQGLLKNKSIKKYLQAYSTKKYIPSYCE